MANLNYSKLIKNVLQPGIQENVFFADLKSLTDIFGSNDKVKPGTDIEDSFRVGYTSAGGSYTTSDSTDPVSSTQTIVNPKWTKKYYHEAVEVENIEIEQLGNAPAIKLVEDALETGAKAIMNRIFTDIMAQLELDIDKTGAYSTAALSRTTYPTLASYEDNTATAITLALFRSMYLASTLKKNAGGPGNYVCLMEQSVRSTFNELVGAAMTWNVNDPKQGQVIAGGKQNIASFEGVDLASPEGMGTGKVLLLRKPDVKIDIHRPMIVKQVPSGKDSVKFVIYAGINGHSNKPGMAGKMTGKL